MNRTVIPFRGDKRPKYEYHKQPMINSQWEIPNNQYYTPQIRIGYITVKIDITTNLLYQL